MKNTFRLMGIALLAGAMLFTACKKDDDDETNDTITTETIANGATITFGSTEWTSSIATAVSANNMVQVSAYKVTGQFPGIQVMTSATEGSIEGSTSENDDDFGLTFNPSNTFVNYYENATVEGLGDWEPLTYTINIVSFDATNFKLSAKVEANMFNYKSYYDEEVDHITNAATKTLKATFGNITLGAAQR